MKKCFFYFFIFIIFSISHEGFSQSPEKQEYIEYKPQNSLEETFDWLIVEKLLPKDKYGYPDWVSAVRAGIINPRNSPFKGDPPEIPRLPSILYGRVGTLPKVLFPHSIHTYWLSCENCHPKPFEEKSGKTPITMTAITRGEYCGKCHGKVAFPLEECFRCHAYEKK